MVQETIRFSTSVAAGESKTLTKRMEADATVEEVEVRFYRGPELAVSVEPYRLKGDPHGSQERRSLVELVGRDVIVGDADVFQFEVGGEEVERTEKIGVEFVNNAETEPEDDVNLDYDVHVDITVDKEGGVTSTSSGSWLAEVFS